MKPILRLSSSPTTISDIHIVVRTMSTVAMKTLVHSSPGTPNEHSKLLLQVPHETPQSNTGSQLLVILTSDRRIAAAILMCHCELRRVEHTYIHLDLGRKCFSISITMLMSQNEPIYHSSHPTSLRGECVLTGVIDDMSSNIHVQYSADHSSILKRS